MGRLSRYDNVSFVKSKTNTIQSTTNDNHPNDKSIEDRLRILIRSKDVVEKCSICGYTGLKYNGLGSYTCLKCNSEQLNNYGKVRRFLDINGQASIVAVMECTNLSKRDIQDLLDSGSISIVNGKLI